MTRRSSSRPALCFHKGTVRHGFEINTTKHLSSSPGILKDMSWHNFQTFSSLHWRKKWKQSKILWSIFSYHLIKSIANKNYLPIARYVRTLGLFWKQWFKRLFITFINFCFIEMHLCIDRHFDNLTAGA